MKIVLTNLKFEKNKITNFRRQEHIGLGYIGANIKLTSLVIIIYLKGGLHKLSYTTEYGLLYINPVYNYSSKKEVKNELFNFGLSTKSLEGTCIFGDTYSIPKREAVISYISRKLYICRDSIKTRTKKESSIIQRPKIHKIGAVIIKEKKILVVRKNSLERPEYIIPGTRSVDEETHEDTLNRGLKEELGVTIESYRLLGSFCEMAIFENIPLYMDVYHVEISGKPKVKKVLKDLTWIDQNYERKGIKIGTILSRHVIPNLISQEIM
jgi:8-oxo-dGTP diphosphatase